MDRALELEPHERAAFVRESCAEDPELAQRALALLADCDAVDGFLGTPVFEHASDALQSLAEGLAEEHSSGSLVGTRLGHFEIVAKLGRGGMGEVYRARDTDLGREVALKVLRRSLVEEPERLERFRLEARLLAALDHPAIVTVFSVEQSDGLDFLTMQLVEGKTLDQLIEAEGLERDRFFEIAIPMVDAVTAAHERGIIHRDLKPSNVMWTDDGRLKVLDFGLAKLTGDADSADLSAPDLVTRGHQILGTLAYMSPEQISGRPIDARSDVFSLGVMLFEMATGRRPYLGADPRALLSEMLESPPPSAHEVRSDLPRRLGQTVAACLHPDPQSRLQTASRLADDLRALRDEEETAGRPPSEQQAPSPGTTPSSPAPETTSSGVRGLRPGVRRLAATAALLVAMGLGWWFWPRGTSDESADARGAAHVPAQKMIAVLPFESFGTVADEALTTGLTVEITSRLSAVDDLGVVSYSSAVRFAESDKNLREIGAELGVDHVLRGTIQWGVAGSGARTVRITPRLERTSDAVQVWSTVYDEPFDDILRIQSDIAVRAIEGLAVELTQPERRDLEARATENREAYQAFLVGLRHREAYKAGASNLDGDQAVESLERAVAHDPEFAQAWAALADVRSLFYLYGRDRSSENLERTRAAIDNALRLAPEEPETNRVLASFHYRVERDYARALEVLERVRSDLGDQAYAMFFYGSVLRRQGRWEESLGAYREALRLDPQSDFIATQLALSYLWMRDHDQAGELADRALALAPENLNAQMMKAGAIFLRTGDAAAARQFLVRSSAKDLSQTAMYAWLAGDPQLALEDLDRLEGDRFNDGLHVWYPVEVARARFLEAAGRAPAARESYQQAARTLEELAHEQPEDPVVQSSLGLVYAGLGRDAEALRHAERATELLPISKDAFGGPLYEFLLAQTLGRLGYAPRVCELVETMLSRPGPAARELLARHPWFDRVRDEPCFQQALGG